MGASQLYVGAGGDVSHNGGVIRSLAGQSASAEQALCHRWFEYHDTAAATRLVASHLNVVGGIATEYGGCRVTTQDLVGEGYVGLMRALCRYDPACDVAFTAYATPYIHAAIQSAIRRSEAAATAPGAGRRGRRTRRRAGSRNGHAAINPPSAYAIGIIQDAAAVVVPQHQVG